MKGLKFHKKSKEAKNLGQKIKIAKEFHAPLVKSHFATSNP
jgi:hypothetical protein